MSLRVNTCLILLLSNSMTKVLVCSNGGRFNVAHLNNWNKLPTVIWGIHPTGRRSFSSQAVYRCELRCLWKMLCHFFWIHPCSKIYAEQEEFIGGGLEQKITNNVLCSSQSWLKLSAPSSFCCAAYGLRFLLSCAHCAPCVLGSFENLGTCFPV